MADDPALMRDNTAPILFLTATRLGDAILTTGILEYLLTRYPLAPVTIVCGRLPAPIFAGLPERCTVMPLKKKRWGLHWLDVYKSCAATRWGLVVDLRNTPVSRLLKKDRLITHAAAPPEDEHRATYFSRLLGLSETRPLKLFLSDEAAMRAAPMMAGRGLKIALAPASNWVGKTWPAENWALLAQGLMQRHKDAHFLVMTGPGEEAMAAPLLRVIPENRLINMIGNNDPGTALACIGHCDLFIGNDSGLMHGAAALGVKTIGLFGPTSETAYGPYGPNAISLRAAPREEIIRDVGDFRHVRTCLMHDLKVEQVAEAAAACFISDKKVFA